MDLTNQKRLSADARASCDVFYARLPWQGMVKLNTKVAFFKFCHHGDTICHSKSGCATSSQQPNSMERLHVDATIMQSFQAELFSCFLPSSYAGHVNLAAAQHWRFMPKWKDGSTV